MTIVPVGFHNVTFIWRAAGASRDSTFQIGFDDMTAPTTTPDTVVDRVYAAYVSDDCPGDGTKYSDQWSFNGCSDAYTDEVGVIVYQHLVSNEGAIASKPVPINSAELVSKQTSSGGRRNRGRLFHPPVHMDEGTVDARGVIASVTVPILQNYFDVFMGELAERDLRPVLFHGSGSTVPTTITGLALQSTLATQRRRMRK
jgi:hypothetical protein